MSLKNILGKITASIVALYLVLGNFAVAGLGIAEVIAETVKTPEIAIEQNIDKYVQYEKNDYKGAIVQTSVKIKEETEKESYLPVKDVSMEISVPKVNGVFPGRVSIIKKDTNLTTGNEYGDLSQNYDSSSGLLVVSYQNTENYTEYKENAKDEFEIIYIYPELAFIGDNAECELNQVTKVKVNYASGKETLSTEKQERLTQKQTENKGEISDYLLKSSTDIYKGYMYANEQYGNTYKTDYKLIEELSILNKDVVDEITIGLDQSLYKDINSKEIKANSIVYKSSKISSTDFYRLFGIDGQVDFYIGDIKYATIKYSDADEKGNRNYETIYYTVEKENIEAGKVEYPSNTKSVTIKTSNPTGEGVAIFENEKQIISQSEYEKEVKNLKEIKESRIFNANKTVKVNEEENIIEIENKNNIGSISLKEPTTKMSLELSSNKLSTLTTNKVTATLKIDDTNSSCKLLEAGNIELTLPQNYKNVKITAKSLYENGITVKSAKVENGKIILEIKGKQTTYDFTNVSGGVNIVIDIELDIDDTVATHKEVITAQYNGTVETKEIEIVSLSELLLISKTSGYDEQNTTVTNIGTTTKQIQISENTSQKEIKHTINIVNNYDEDIKDVQIIGRIGYYNSTFETKLTKPISTNKQDVKIYYSNNKNAVYNDSDWTEQFSNNAKSYKIVLNNNILSREDSVVIDMYAQIPANIGYNQTTFVKTDFTYKYNNISKTTSSTINLYTAKDEIVNNETKNENQFIELSINPCITQNYVHAGQNVVYKIKIRNKTNQKLENISLEDLIPDNAIYTYKQEKQEQGANYFEIVKDESKKDVKWVTSLDANEFKEFEISLIMKENTTEEQKIQNKVNATYNNETISVISQLTLKPSKIVVDLSIREEKWVGVNYTIGDIVEYHINVKNIFNKTINNIKVQYNIPQNLSFVEGGLGEYDDINGYSILEQGILSNNIFEYDINSLGKDETKTIVVKCKVERLQSSYEANINSITNVIVDQDIYQSNLKTIKTIQPGYTISMQSSQKEADVLVKGDNITYTIIVKNIGKLFGGFTILDKIPEEIEVNNISYRANDGETISISTSKNDIELTNSLEVGQTLIINISGTVKEVSNSENKNIRITNVATILSAEYEQKSNEITNIVKCIETENPSTPENPDEPSTPDNPDTQEIKKYSISGIAWLDNNKNGVIDKEEPLLSNIKVYLVNTETGKIVKDSQGKEIFVTTSDKGEYKFEDINKGSYLVIFEFDTNKYKVTKYQVQDTEATLNSDAIISKITIDGNQKLVGVTNVLDLKSNLEHINIGLIENAKFDLSLEKQISKVEVINSQGTKTTEYENLNFAKVDLVAKYMNNTSVIVTYKFIITNNGDVTGYVDSLKDNLPSGLEFSSELNKDWYKGEDGDLYTSALSGIAIEPGKTSEIELILTKETTEESTGTFKNKAELAKISNIEAVEESNTENNKASADLVISIKTGSALLYIGITLGSITLVACGAYIIKKKILDKGI